MATKRSDLIDYELTRYYHCCTRAVRAAFIIEQLSSKLRRKKANKPQYSQASPKINRRAWLEQRILFLPSVFAIEVCAYAVMSNHYHVVLKANPEKVASWSDLEVLKRWHQLYQGTETSRAYLAGLPMSPAQQTGLSTMIKQCRQKLADISWFMRNINEPLARLANKEDGKKGRFWESRFKSQALLDEQALLTCMAYVDLNPIRANMANTVLDSHYTSGKLRAKAAKQAMKTHKKATVVNHIKAQPPALSAFCTRALKQATESNTVPNAAPKYIEFAAADYLELLDATGRCIREDKRGYIHQQQPKLLSQLGIQPQQFIEHSRHFSSRFHRFIGCLSHIKQACAFCHINRSQGEADAKQLFGC